jgi:ankyrin repeat protein
VKRALTEQPALGSLKDEEGTPILLHAAEAREPAIVELLLQHGAGLGDHDPGGETALHRVADRRRAQPEGTRRVVALLLDRGAVIDARNWDQVTPLHQAVRARNVAAVEVLLAHGADANARDRRGSTPLRRAVCGTGAGGTAGTSDLMVVLARLLLEHGADPDARDERGTPVHASARRPELRAVLAEFRRHGAG